MDLVNFKVGNENFKDPEQPGIFSGLEIFFYIKQLYNRKTFNLRGEYHQQMANSSRNMQK